MTIVSPNYMTITIIVVPKRLKPNKPPDSIFQYVYLHLNILNLHLNVYYQISPKISFFSIINLIFVLHTQLHNKFIVSLKCYLSQYIKKNYIVQWVYFLIFLRPLTGFGMKASNIY